MDSLDYKIIELLMDHGRMTWSDLAAQLGLSAPAAAERVRRLEERGVLKGYAGIVEPESVGCDLAAFIAVTLERPEHRAAFLARVDELAAIQECHHIAGEHDYILKVRCRHTRDLENIISVQLKSLPGVVRTQTTIILDTIKETLKVPFFHAES